MNPTLPFVKHLLAPSMMGGFRFIRNGVSDMSVDHVRPEVNLLFAFTLTIAGAIAVGLPMAVAIIWICA
jgi:hypothetical protein